MNRIVVIHLPAIAAVVFSLLPMLLAAPPAPPKKPKTEHWTKDKGKIKSIQSLVGIASPTGYYGNKTRALILRALCKEEWLAEKQVQGLLTILQVRKDAANKKSRRSVIPLTLVQQAFPEAPPQPAWEKAGVQRLQQLLGITANGTFEQGTRHALSQALCPADWLTQGFEQLKDRLAAVSTSCRPDDHDMDLVFLGVFEGERRDAIQGEDKGPPGKLDEGLTEKVEQRLAQDGYVLVPRSRKCAQPTGTNYYDRMANEAGVKRILWLHVDPIKCQATATIHITTPSNEPQSYADIDCKAKPAATATLLGNAAIELLSRSDRPGSPRPLAKARVAVPPQPTPTVDRSLVPAAPSPTSAPRAVAAATPVVPPPPVVPPALAATTTPAAPTRRRTLGWWTLGVSAVVTGVGVGLLAMNGKDAPGSCPQGTKQYQCTWDFHPALYGSFLAVGGAGLVGSVLLLIIPEPARPAIERNK